MINLLHGDCLELLKNIPDKSIDLVVTDPPYKFGSKGGDFIQTITAKKEFMQNP